MTEISNFDASEYLDTDEKIADYLSSIIEDKDWDLLLRAIGHIAKAKGMTQIAKSTGLGRESLYKAFNSTTQPKFDTVIRVLDALNMSFELHPNDSIKPKDGTRARPRTIRPKKSSSKIAA
jgi:probable addiction module antidote protein